MFNLCPRTPVYGYIYSNLTGGQAAGGIPTVAGQSIAADVAGYYQQLIRIGKQKANLFFQDAEGKNGQNVNGLY